MDALSQYSGRLERALEIAAVAHKDQLRKGTEVPYVVHPVHVGILLMKYGFGEDVVVAGLLHDVVEDTTVSADDIEASFGAAVARLVASVTEQKTEPSADGTPSKRPWRVRKEDQLRVLEGSCRDVAAIKAADALHNCQSTLRDLERRGTAAWERFRSPPEEQLWYMRSVARCVRSRLGEHPLVQELEQVIDRLAAFVT
jgi:(p)ppGpp synthase/HD superfamily hydrolase